MTVLNPDSYKILCKEAQLKASNDKEVQILLIWDESTISANYDIITIKEHQAGLYSYLTEVTLLYFYPEGTFNE